LVHQNPNWIAINEPKALFKQLNQAPLPIGIDRLYRQLRDDINQGVAVENKIHQGQVIEDTAVQNSPHQVYQPQVSRDDFLLLTKNTLGYTARLPQLRQVLPQAKIIACIRHPLDTIASWKTSFAHLQQVDVENFVVGSLHDPLLDDWQRQQVELIVAQSSLAQRRALFWAYLCHSLLKVPDLLWLPYEQTVQNPRGSLEKIAQWVGNCPPLSVDLQPDASQARYKRAVLDSEDRDAIHAHCTEVATQFGYALT